MPPSLELPDQLILSFETFPPLPSTEYPDVKPEPFLKMKNSYASTTVSTCPSAVMLTALLALLLPLTAVTVHVPAEGITNRALPVVSVAVSVTLPFEQVQTLPEGYVTSITA